jgi:hypothetical protein
MKSKFNTAKKLLWLLFAITPIVGFAQNTGGPDAYGYTWANNLAPAGPAYNWIDITTTGTQMQGLTDDNAAPALSMGMPFHYYWSDYTEVVIGSNGWLSFNNVSNIAHCFPTIPTMGGAGDNILAPFMTDLNFSGATNPAEVWYEHDAANQRFIVSYINVPWWKNTPTGFAGVNTFQVILSNIDSSITFQYLTTDVANFLDNATCAADLEIGIENLTGNIGLELFNDIVPTALMAYKFSYPATVLLSVPDATPEWTMNTESAGSFYGTNSTFDVNTNISNVGNADITNDIFMANNLLSPSFSVAWTGLDTINGLLAGNSQASNFTAINSPTTAGQYTLNSLSSNSQDINPSNNNSSTEINFVDLSQASVTLSYVNGNLNDGSVSWSSGGGLGTYFKPPTYPILIDSLSFEVNVVTAQAFYSYQVLDDDGPNGSPGTILYSDSVLSNPMGTQTWQSIALSNAIQIDSGGFYVAWIDYNSNAISRTTTAPISKRSFEFLGSWAQYRDNSAHDLFINAIMELPCQALSASPSSITPITCNGASDGAVTLAVSGGTAPFTLDWAGVDSTALSAGVYYYTITNGNNCSKMDSITIVEPSVLAGSTTTQDEVAGSDGSIDLTVSGGTAGYTFLWSNGEVTEDISGLIAGSYTCTVTDVQGCSNVVNATVSFFSGISQLDLNKQVNVYPNPSTGHIHIITNNITDKVQFEIYNLLGAKVSFELTQAANHYQMTLVSPPAGVYIIKGRTNDQVFNKEVIIR